MVALIQADTSLWPDVIVGPANGGNKLCECLAPTLSEALGYEIKVVLTEKIRLDGADNFGFQDRDLRLDGRRVLVIDDVLTKGRSTGQVVNIARAIGAEILGIVVAVGREGLTSQRLGVPLYRYLIALRTNSYNVPKEWRHACPLCMGNVLINTEFGHGAAEVAKSGQPYFLECGE
jgi:orotate phosphoribosyltransferase